eukprot:TRINITY_DN11680_c0_g1_i1.p1 TRINITY_DN11680_c0_g1~~TRINITY_DN11680_c0_g1_i1.p1  ORF type:complete len:133 (+),score=7.54 TRINITY_DN11680_c0_g1_i1:108-506(+)
MSLPTQRQDVVSVELSHTAMEVLRQFKLEYRCEEESLSDSVQRLVDCYREHNPPSCLTLCFLLETGEKIWMKVQPQTLIETLERAMAARCNVSRCDVRLLHSAQRMRCKHSIGHYIRKDGDTVDVILAKQGD